MDVFVARQPIFDREKAVFAYELLFRSGFENYYDGLDPNKATIDVISNSFFVIGFDKLTDGKTAFINFTRDLLTKGVAGLLPTEAVTVEILEDIEPDDQMVGVCKELKESGFTIAMDDFVSKDRGNPLVEYADIVKVDFMGTDAKERESLCRMLTDQGVEPLAEKVETAEEFDQALEWGYSYFQGYFFAKPSIQSAKKIAGNKLAYLQVLYEINQPGIAYDDLETAIKQDISLTYQLLRFMNSAWFGFRSDIESIHHALVLLGPKEIKKWFALITLNHMASDKPHELILRAVSRAKIAETLAPIVGMKNHRSELFLLGMFSLIDALTDTPMTEIVEKLPLHEDVKKALLGQNSRFKPVYDMILAYEKGDWNPFSAAAQNLGLDESVVPEVVKDSLQWANEAFATL